MNKIELLAPAGDLARAKIAIMYGANAVYLGGKSFSLRSRASNFELSDIAEAVIFAKQYQALIYVTVNIIPHDEDLDGLDEYLRALADRGVAAIICSSLYIAKISKQVAPQMEVHLSTQQSVTNSAAIAYYQKMGIDRIVLARELSITEINLTNKHSALPLEAFIHGGMCANYSGRCTISNFMTNRDANRGGCAHSCRWFYHLFENDKMIDKNDELFTMAARDLSAAAYIAPLIDINVVSLKIEGRMKSAYYIAAVVKTYRLLIDEYYQKGVITLDRLNWYQQELNKSENRDVSDGYLNGIPQEDPIKALIKSTASQEFVGYIRDYRDDSALVEIRNRFVKGDRLEILSPTCDNRQFVVETIFDEENEAIDICNKPMQLVWIKIPYPVNEHDMLRRGDDNVSV